MWPRWAPLRSGHMWFGAFFAGLVGHQRCHQPTVKCRATNYNYFWYFRFNEQRRQRITRWRSCNCWMSIKLEVLLHFLSKQGLTWKSLLNLRLTPHCSSQNLPFLWWFKQCLTNFPNLIDKLCKFWESFKEVGLKLSNSKNKFVESQPFIKKEISDFFFPSRL